MKSKIFLLVVLVMILSSCGKYTTPGASANISELADPDIAKILANKPTSEFPINMAVARIQAPQYSNYHNRQHVQTEEAGFSMILTRNAVEEEAISTLSELEEINQVSPFNRLLLPYNYKSIKDLRLAAAKMKAQMLLVYTFDTAFIIDTKNYGPQNGFTLGYLKNKEVKVVTTASAAIFDVQTEYLYGLAEATSRANKKSNAWKKFDAVDAMRIKTEQEAFVSLVQQLEDTWTDIRLTYDTPETERSR